FPTRRSSDLFNGIQPFHKHTLPLPARFIRWRTKMIVARKIYFFIVCKNHLNVTVQSESLFGLFSIFLFLASCLLLLASCFLPPASKNHYLPHTTPHNYCLFPVDAGSGA